MSSNIQDAVNAVNGFGVKVDTLITETTNANSRFEAKLAGFQAQIADLQSQVTALQAQVASGADTSPIVAALTDLGTKVDNQTAAEQVSGV